MWIYSESYDSEEKDIHTKVWRVMQIVHQSIIKIKTMVTFIYRYIRDNVLQDHPLHQHQYAYRTGKSIEVTLTQPENTCEVQ